MFFLCSSTKGGIKLIRSITYIIGSTTVVQKWAKESKLLIHPFGYDRSRQNKSLRDEELRKVEHLSTTNHLIVHIGQLNQK